MRKFSLCLILFLIVEIASGQKQGKIWMFGQGAALNFNSGSPISFSGSQVFSNPTQVGDYAYSEGCTSISDSSGNLLFYSNGEKVWNSSNQVMLNGDYLDGFYSSTTAALAIPAPNSDSLYYLFTTDGIERYLANGLRYSMINMCLDNGNGDVINSQKNIFLLDTVSEKLCAIAHPNGTDIWVIAHKHFTNSFYAYLITPSGINPPVITNIGSIHTGNMGFYNGCGTAIGQMKASTDGSKIALVFSNVNPAVAEFFDFNSTTGIISNKISLLTYNNEYGVEFSPDNSKLYTTSIHGIVQFDISSGSQSTINSSAIQISSSVCLPRPIQLGPDGKIYVTQCSNYLGVINDPNMSGIGCNYVSNSVSILPGDGNTSLPSFIAGFNYTNKRIPKCETMGLQNISLSQITIYPNPFITEITIDLNRNVNDGVIIMFNAEGQEIKRITNINGEMIHLPRGNLLPGIYFAELIEPNNSVTFMKLLVVD
jgi:hypothetical protein